MHHYENNFRLSPRIQDLIENLEVWGEKQLQKVDKDITNQFLYQFVLLIMLNASIVGQVMLGMVLVVFQSFLWGATLLLQITTQGWYIWYMFADQPIQSKFWNIIFKGAMVANPILSGILAIKMVTNVTAIVTFAFNLISMILMFIYTQANKFENQNQKSQSCNSNQLLFGVIFMMACSATVAIINGILVPTKVIFSFLYPIPQLFTLLYIALPKEVKASVDGLFQFFGFMEFIVGLAMTMYYGIAIVYLYVLFGDPTDEGFESDVIRLCGFLVVLIQAGFFLNYVNSLV